LRRVAAMALFQHAWLRTRGVGGCGDSSYRLGLWAHAIWDNAAPILSGTTVMRAAGARLARDHLQLALVVSDALCQRAYLLQDRPEGHPECRRDVLDDLLVKAPGRALGKASTEGFDRSSNVIDQLRAGTRPMPHASG
jgi:hypothetical protein